MVNFIFDEVGFSSRNLQNRKNRKWREILKTGCDLVTGGTVAEVDVQVSMRVEEKEDRGRKELVDSDEDCE